jgi:indolepyruvate ferredoxin oxidoreductase
MGINQGPISLDQKYTQGSGHVFLTGIQALVRLPMAQIRRDRAAGLNTAGFVTGYRRESTSSSTTSSSSPA